MFAAWVLQLITVILLISALVLDNLTYAVQEHKKGCLDRPTFFGVEVNSVNLVFGWRTLYVRWHERKKALNNRINGDIRLPYTIVHKHICGHKHHSAKNKTNTTSLPITTFYDKLLQSPMTPISTMTNGGTDNSEPSPTFTMPPLSDNSSCRSLNAATVSGVLFFSFVLLGAVTAMTGHLLAAMHVCLTVPWKWRTELRHTATLLPLASGFCLLFALTTWFAYFSQNVTDLIEDSYLGPCFDASANKFGASVACVIAAIGLQLVAAIATCYGGKRPQQWYEFVRNARHGCDQKNADDLDSEHLSELLLGSDDAVADCLGLGSEHGGDYSFNEYDDYDLKQATAGSEVPSGHHSDNGYIASLAAAAPISSMSESRFSSQFASRLQSTGSKGAGHSTDTDGSDSHASLITESFSHSDSCDSSYEIHMITTGASVN